MSMLSFILGKDLENRKNGDVLIKIADKDPYDYPGTYQQRRKKNASESNGCWIKSTRTETKE